MSQSESPAHLELKRLALAWAQAQGYRVAAVEVTVPERRFRLDVAAYRPHRVRVSVHDERRDSSRFVSRQAIGMTAVFECKASRPDYRRDAQSIVETKERLKALGVKKTRLEQDLRLFYPSIRNGDSLFQEYETLDFERPGHERYEQTLKEISRLTSRLHAGTKFDKLVQWGVANLFYIVAEPDTVEVHETPGGWGLLVREAASLRVVSKPILHEVAEHERLLLLHRISMAATRAVHREHGVSREAIAHDAEPH